MSRHLSLFLAAPATVLLASLAAAQIVPTAPFTGQQSESFETQNSFGFHPCVIGRVFNNTADLCDPAFNSMSLTGGWSFFCQIGPHSGNILAGSAGGPAEWIFDQPASRFGGFFGNITNVDDAVVEFYDVNNVLITALPLITPANCTWSWSGWHVQSGPLIHRAKIIGNNPYNGGGFIMMDSMEVEYGPGCPTPTAYCTAKVNSLGCTPQIGFVGASSAGAPSGFVVQGSNVRNQKAGILFYGLNGPASTPFQGGTLCVKTPIRRTPAINSGGTSLPTNDCTGVYSIDMNTFAQGGLGGSPSPSLLVPGTQVHCQFWGRDPGFPAPNNTTLTDGLEYTVCP